MRHKIATLAALPLREKALLASAWIWLFAVDLALRVVPFPRVRGLMVASRSTPWKVEEVSAERLRYLIEVAARHHLYEKTCLCRSLVLERWLRQSGLNPQLRIGVRRDGGGLQAHAWVEVQGRPIGDHREEDQHFLPLLGCFGEALW